MSLGWTGRCTICISELRYDQFDKADSRNAICVRKEVSQLLLKISCRYTRTPRCQSPRSIDFYDKNAN